MPQRVRVFIAASLDGFIAGPDGDLSWLPDPPQDLEEDFGWSKFIADIGCLLMGRATYDAIAAMEIPWPHPERETLVATTRPLNDAPRRVQAAQGDIAALVAKAKTLAQEKDVYLDGGNLIRQALDAGLVDQLILTLCPIILGTGHPLFAGTRQRHGLALLEQRALPGGLIQLNYAPGSLP